jgi:hypothetical protein
MKMNLFRKISKYKKFSEKLNKIPNLKEFITDNYKRTHNYLRISITERCNLRCQVIYLLKKVLYA